MAFSENWDLITLSGTYLNSDGSPVQGAVVLTPTPVRMVDLAALKTVIGNQMRIPLDANGHFSVQVPATDDPDITPINFTYQVREDFPGGATYHIEVPFETEGELNIATIAPQAEASPGELVATVPGPPGPKGDKGDPGLSEEELSATYGARSRALLPAGTLAGEVTSAATVTPVVTIDGIVYGAGPASTTIYRSTDDGATWASIGTTPSGIMQMLAKTSDGEMLLWTPTACYKSTGWAGGSPSWTEKIAVNGEARFNRFTVSAPDPDGNGATKIICTEYGPGAGQAWIDSRYGHISTDAGESFTQAWDSDTETGNGSEESHVHGCCYDPWEDLFIVSEGHGADYGLWTSEDDGATWTRRANMSPSVQPGPTNVVATDDGLVCASDGEPGGVYGVVRGGELADRKMRLLYKWNAGGNTGINGHGQAHFRDPATGIVYLAFRGSTPDAKPIITAATAATATLVATWEGSFVAGDDWRAVTVAGEHLLAGGTFDSANVAFRAPLTRTGSTGLVDTGNAIGGEAPSASSVAVGPRSSATSSQSVVVGRAAVSQGSDHVVIGADATGGTSPRATVLGSGATAGGATDQTAVGAFADPDTNQYSTVIGAYSATTGTQGTAIGRQATAHTRGTSIGAGASAIATDSVAIGNAAAIGAAGHVGSIAIGSSATTTKGAQVALGARHIELSEVSTEPGAGAANTGRLYLRDNGSGKTQLVVQFPTGAVIVLATEA